MCIRDRNKVDLRAEWPLQGIQSEKVASGRCSPIRPIMWLYSASVVLVWDSFLPFTLLWPYSSKVHLVLATALFFLPTRIFLFFTLESSSTAAAVQLGKLVATKGGSVRHEKSSSVLHKIQPCSNSMFESMDS